MTYGERTQGLTGQRLLWPQFVGVLVVVFTSVGTISAAELKTTFAQNIQPVLEQYCYKCHSPPKPKGDVNLRQFNDEAAVFHDPKLWQTVRDRLYARKMPPEGKPQPAPEDRERVGAWVQQ